MLLAHNVTVKRNHEDSLENENDARKGWDVKERAKEVGSGKKTRPQIQTAS